MIRKFSWQSNGASRGDHTGSVAEITSKLAGQTSHQTDKAEAQDSLWVIG